LLYGINFPDFVRTYKNIPVPKKVSDGNFEELVPNLLNLYKKNPVDVSNDVKKYILQAVCVECNGTRLAWLGREVTFNSKTIIDVTRCTFSELLAWLQNLDNLLKEDELPVLTAFSSTLKKRTSHVIEVGLPYLTLDCTLPTLSAGESQRLRLAGLLGSGLTGVLYVVDESTTGLHPHDTAKLLQTLKKIQEAGNTVLIIEHDMDVVGKANYILDIGPAGVVKVDR
jgi:excinuclease ABC subunit A